MHGSVSQEDGAWKPALADQLASCADYKDSSDWTAETGAYWMAGGGQPYKLFCEMDSGGGGWTLVANLNPSDGHTHGYSHGDWDNLNPWEAQFSDALRQDYKSVIAYEMAANEVMVVNHIEGVVNAFKTWPLADESTTFLAEMVARTTTGPEAQFEGTAPGCPIMSLSGALQFSATANSNDGARVGIAGAQFDSQGNEVKGLGISIGISNAQYEADSLGLNPDRNGGNPYMGTDGGSSLTGGTNPNQPVYHYAIYVR